MKKNYQVKLDIFEGPLDLLLFLVGEERIEVFDLELANITRQFLDYLKLMKNFDIAFAGEYIVLASTLIRLKAERLLPAHEDIEMDECDLDGYDFDSEYDDAETMEGLQNKLRDLKKFQEMASALRTMEQSGKRLYEGCPPGGPIVKEVLEFKLNIPRLFAIYKKVIQKKAPRRVHQIRLEPRTQKEKIKYIQKILFQDRGEKDFIDLLEETQNMELEVILTFLSLLDLAKNQKVNLSQEGEFSPLKVRLSVMDSSETPSG